MAQSNEIIAKDTAEHTRKWWAIQRGFKNMKHMCSFWCKRVTVRHYRHWNLMDPAVSFTSPDKLGKKERKNNEFCRLQL